MERECRSVKALLLMLPSDVVSGGVQTRESAIFKMLNLTKHLLSKKFGIRQKTRFCRRLFWRCI